MSFGIPAEGEVLGSIWVAARKMTHKGASLIDSLEFLRDVKGYDSFGANGLIEIRQRMRDEHSQRVRQQVEDYKKRESLARKESRRQLEAAADALLNRNPHR